MFNPNCTGEALTVLAIGGREGRPPHVACPCLLKGRKVGIYASNANSREPGTLERYCVLIQIESDVCSTAFLALSFLESNLNLAERLAHIVAFDRFEHFRDDGIAEIELLGDLREEHNGETAVVAVDETEIFDVKGFVENLRLIALVASLHERNTLVFELCEITHLSNLSILLTRPLRVIAIYHELRITASLQLRQVKCQV